jgi:hypothetical protein
MVIKISLWGIPLYMKRTTTLLLCLIIIVNLSAQEMGFRTTDIGGEYQHYNRGSVYNLHLAFNAKLNHSIQLRLGYNQVPTFNAGSHTETGKGWGGGLGYRYYFNPFPYKFFAGVRIDAWRMKIENDYSPADFFARYDPVWIIHPALETGYTFVINDMVYFTPYLSAGFHSDFDQLKTVKYGNGFVATMGVSAGIRL